MIVWNLDTRYLVLLVQNPFLQGWLSLLQSSLHHAETLLYSQCLDFFVILLVWFYLMWHKEATARSDHHQRTVLWSFENLQMLIGTDLPIFGGGTRPCISLRLR